MIYQTSKDVLEWIHKSGCKVLSTLRIFEIVSGYSFTVNEVNTIYEVAQKVGYIGKGRGPKGEGYVNEHGTRGLGQIASAESKFPIYMEQVDSNSPYQFIIAEFARVTTNNVRVTHFPLVSIDKPTIVSYDPWSASGSKTVREGKIIGYRYIYAERT